ncbi:MAG: siderophore-interacting protein [Rhodococcus sp. (in: high G+C Gram-positive bacteria)]|jgi:NADPH-dependent ferric siderophore reductase|uniref:siderophore-interacting protein n=1 Tax=Rhodococcus sp. EPR-157 TaxID=1813677 RepID=UPI0007BB6944|nr:siderophore-interacting protein [Rhodococcus sp. EPR-157]KZF10988.1 NADPH-dependent ferric siderophore reductase [Rhodococcus sp. EPR-157]
MTDNRIDGSAEKGYWFAEVVEVEQLTPHMVRVTFGGDDVAEYTSIGVPDECITIFFARDGEDRPPAMTEVDGTWWYHEVEPMPEGRNYTVRRFDTDTGLLVIDFVAHEGGVAATWALNASVGQVVLWTRPRSWYNIPDSAEWQLLVADMTGLPALGRIVEELPAGAKAHAIVEVLERGDIQQFETAGDVTYDWRIGSGNGDCASVLDAAVREYVLPEGEGYVWFAAEAASSRIVRKYIRKEVGYPVRQFEIIGYWRVNSEQWLEKYKKYQEEALAVYNGALEAGRSETEASEEFDALLERVGL